MGFKIKSTDETHVYISRSGYLAIKQVSNLGEESVIALSPHQAKLVADELYRQLEDTSWWEDAESDEETDVVTQMNLDAAERLADNAGIGMQMNLDSSKQK